LLKKTKVLSHPVTWALVLPLNVLLLKFPLKDSTKKYAVQRKKSNCEDMKIPKGLSLKSNLNHLQWLSAASMTVLLGLSRCFLLQWCEVPLLSLVQAFGQNCVIPPSLNVKLNGENPICIMCIKI